MGDFLDTILPWRRNNSAPKAEVHGHMIRVTGSVGNHSPFYFNAHQIAYVYTDNDGVTCIRCHRGEHVTVSESVESIEDAINKAMDPSDED